MDRPQEPRKKTEPSEKLGADLFASMAEETGDTRLKEPTPNLSPESRTQTSPNPETDQSPKDRSVADSPKPSSDVPRPNEILPPQPVDAKRSPVAEQDQRPLETRAVTSPQTSSSALPFQPTASQSSAERPADAHIQSQRAPSLAPEIAKTAPALERPIQPIIQAAIQPAIQPSSLSLDRSIPTTQPVTDSAHPARTLDSPAQSVEKFRPAQAPPEVHPPNGQSALRSLSPSDLHSGSLVLPIPEHLAEATRKSIPEQVRKETTGDLRPSVYEPTSKGNTEISPKLKLETLEADPKQFTKSENTRLPQIPPTEGKIAEAKQQPDLPQKRLPFDGKIPEGKIADGKTDRPGDSSNPLPAKTALKSGEKDLKDPDKPTGKKDPGGASSGPSAFIQFIESQAGIRPAFPALDKGDKSNKPDKSEKTDKSDQSEKGKKTESKAEPVAKNSGIKAESPKPEGTKSGAVRNQLPGVENVKVPVVKPDSIRSGVDGLLGFVDTVKENIKGALKGQRDRPAEFGKGEFAVVSQKSRAPSVRGDVSDAAEIIAVLIPSHLVKWSIVRAPGIKPSDVSPPPQKIKPFRAASIRAVDQKPTAPELKPTQPAPKAFDINNPPEKNRPFIQLHAADSEYSADGRPSAPRRAVAKAEQPAEPKVDVVKTPATPASTPWLDLPEVRNAAAEDQSSTRPTINPDLAEKRRLVEEQEHTLPTPAEDSEEFDLVKLQDRLTLSEQDKRYVNKAIDVQESTWNSEDDAGAKSPAMLRYAYIVRPGDTVESVAVAELHDSSLAPLLYEKNRKYVLPEVEYGIHPFIEGAVIDLPTPAEISAFRQL